MALNARIQATCLLLLVLVASLASGAVLQHQTGQLADLQPQHPAETQAGLTLMPSLQRLRRRDTHFPICVFCCGCCKASKCGMCCKT